MERFLPAISLLLRQIKLNTRREIKRFKIALRRGHRALVDSGQLRHRLHVEFPTNVRRPGKPSQPMAAREPYQVNPAGADSGAGNSPTLPLLTSNDRRVGHLDGARPGAGECQCTFR